MKKRILKRLIASVMCLGIMLSFVPQSISAEYNYDDVVNLATTLNIIPEKIDANAFVTRKELAKFVCYMINTQENGAVYANKSFYDVSEDNEYYDYISIMAGYNLMVGIEEGVFAPDNRATFAMVVKVLIDATGYYPLAREGDMNSYVQVAASKGMFDNVSYAPNDYIKVGELVQIIWNTLQMNAVETTISGKQKHVVTDVNLLWHYHSIDDGRGMVTATEYTSLNDADGITEGYVKIDKTIYRVGTDRVINLIGRNIDFYYKEHNDFDEKIVMWAQSRTAKEYIFDATEIQSVEGTSFVTKVGSKEKAYTLSGQVNVIFNGKYRPYDARDLQPLIGNVELVDSDQNRVYEMVIVTSYVPYVVKRADVSNNTIYDKSSKPRIEFSEDARVTMTKNGVVANINDIKADNVLLVAADKTTYDANDVLTVDSTNSVLYDILVSDKKLIGTLSEIDREEQCVNFDGVQYDIRATFDSSGNTNVQIGKEQTYYLDAFGNIVYCDVAVSEAGTSVKGIYGFVTKIKYNNVYEVVSIRTFNNNAEWNTYELAEKVRIDGKTYKTPQTIYDALTDPSLSTRANGRFLTNADSTFYAFMAVYRLNDEGKINFIDTPHINTQKEGYDDSLYADYYRINGKEQNIFAGGAEVANTTQNYVFLGTWNSKYVIKTGTAVIEIPYDKTNNVVMVKEDNERFYKTNKTAESIEGFEGMIFNAGEDKIPEFVLRTKAFSTTGERVGFDYKSNIISKIIDTINSDNEPIKRISIMGPDGRKTLDVDSNVPLTHEKKSGDSTVTEEITLDALNVGDVIGYQADGNKVLGITRRFSLYTGTGTDKTVDTNYDLTHNGTTRYNPGYTATTWGKVYLANDGVVHVYVGSDYANRQVYDLSNTTLYCYDMADNTIKNINIDELRDYLGMGQDDTLADRIFIGSRHTNGTEAFVYRNIE